MSIIVGSLRHRIGDSFSYLGEFLNEDTQLPQNMTTWTVEASLWGGQCSAVPLEVSWIDQAAGMVKFNLSPENSAALDPGTYELQIRTISPENDSVSIVPAKVVVRE